jgi:hypothetical protein
MASFYTFWFLSRSFLSPVAAWGRDDDFEAEADDKKAELLWAVLASYLPTGTKLMIK